MLSQLHIELILPFFGNAKTIARQIAGTSYSHALGVLIEVVRIEYIYFGMYFL